MGFAGFGFDDETEAVLQKVAAEIGNLEAPMIEKHGEFWWDDCTTDECENVRLALGPIYAAEDEALDAGGMMDMLFAEDGGEDVESTDWDVVEALNFTGAGQVTGFEFEEHAVGHNIVKLQLYYTALNYQAFEETPLHTSTGLLASIAGLTGLWLGFSVSTILEMVEFMAIIIYKRPSLSRFKGTE